MFISFICTSFFPHFCKLKRLVIHLSLILKEVTFLFHSHFFLRSVFLMLLQQLYVWKCDSETLVFNKQFSEMCTKKIVINDICYHESEVTTIKLMQLLFMFYFFANMEWSTALICKVIVEQLLFLLRCVVCQWSVFMCVQLPCFILHCRVLFYSHLYLLDYPNFFEFSINTSYLLIFSNCNKTCSLSPLIYYDSTRHVLQNIFHFNGLNWSLLVKCLVIEDIHNSWL